MESSTFAVLNTSAENYTSYIWDVNTAYSKNERAVFLALYIVIILVAGFGNILTICAFVMYKNLRTLHNTYIINLAAADAVVGFFSLPIYVYVFYGLDYNWSTLGVLCRLWLTIDYIVTSVGTLAVALISYDRYCLVAHGVEYMTSQTMFKVRVRCCFMWISSLFVWAPGILFYEFINGRSTEPSQCLLEFRHNAIYMTIVITFNLVLPLGSTAIFNFLLQLEIRKRSKMFGTGNEQEDNRLKRDKRAARSLTFLVLALMFCWGPWQVGTIYDIICQGCTPYQVWDIGTLLFWFNSSINPVLYALSYPKFRQAFTKMLMPWKKAQVHNLDASQTQNTDA